MTPKEKAIQLIDKFNNYTVKAIKHYPNGKMVECKDEAKECALIAVDEIFGFLSYESHIKYWLEVKQEIEKL
jgi:hypothetical protein